MGGGRRLPLSGTHLHFHQGTGASAFQPGPQLPSLPCSITLSLALSDPPEGHTLLYTTAQDSLTGASLQARPQLALDCRKLALYKKLNLKLPAVLPTFWGWAQISDSDAALRTRESRRCVLFLIEVPEGVPSSESPTHTLLSSFYWLPRKGGPCVRAQSPGNSLTAQGH